MKITINILKRHLYVTAILIAVFLGALFAIAYNSAGTGGNPPSMGHSIDEIDWSKKIPVAVVIDNTLTAKDLQVNGRIRAVGYDISDNAGVSTLVGGKLGTIQNGYGSGESCMEIDFSKTTCFQRGSYCTFVVITDYNGNDDVRVLRSQVAASHDDKPDTANIVHVRHTSGGEAHLRWNWVGAELL